MERKDLFIAPQNGIDYLTSIDVETLAHTHTNSRRRYNQFSDVSFEFCKT